jgi:hypothetical protein
MVPILRCEVLPPHAFKPDKGVVSLQVETEMGRRMDFLFPCADAHRYALFTHDVEEVAYWRIVYFPATNRIHSMKSKPYYSGGCVIQ